jgi:hypothetical protein
MSYPTNVMRVDEVNHEGVPLDTTTNMRLSWVCGLASRQRVSLTVQGFDELTQNEKDKLYSSIYSIPGRAEAEGKKVAM